MMKYTYDDVRRMVKEDDVKFIRLQFVDIFGRVKNVAITVEQLEKCLDGQIMFDGGAIEGFVRIEESDMYLKPDPETFVIFPWRPQTGRVARMICDVYNADGTPFEGCPRNILKKAIKEVADMGYTFNVGPECEFFLFMTDENGNPTTKTHDKAGYFDLGPIDMGENCRRDICLALEKMGFEIEASHHEVAPGQHEIDFRYDDALSTADNIITFKLVVKTIAQRHGLHATFMPKPLSEVNGSGMHLHLSLCKDGQNIFFNESDEKKLSSEAYWFMGGLFDKMREITAITNPLVNSYKRLVPGYEAPVYVAWSPNNRSPLMRIPSDNSRASRIELRSPDPTCNPYLALALILRAGVSGIKNKISPPDPITKNIYELSDTEILEMNIQKLPESLKDAIELLKQSEFAKNALGEHTFNKYIEAKEFEWQQYNKIVHAWETGEYLLMY